MCKGNQISLLIYFMASLSLAFHRYVDKIIKLSTKTLKNSQLSVLLAHWVDIIRFT